MGFILDAVYIKVFSDIYQCIESICQCAKFRPIPLWKQDLTGDNVLR